MFAPLPATPAGGAPVEEITNFQPEAFCHSLTIAPDISQHICLKNILLELLLILPAALVDQVE